ncbi:right-handed parallel beta-helix repeat-containing protein [Longispora urticae]
MRRTLSVATVLVALTAGVGVTGGSASAAVTDLFVNNTVACSDAGTGSQAQPYCTLAAAAGAVTAGQTVRVTGTYAEHVTIAKSGTAGNPITFRGGPQDDSFWLLTGPGVGIKIDGQHDVSILNVQIMGALQTAAIHVAHSTGVTVDQVKLRNEGPQAVPGVRLEAVTGSAVKRAAVTGNMSNAISLDAATSGVTVTSAHIYAVTTAPRPGGIQILGSNNTVVRSVLIDTAGTGITLGAGADGNVVAGNNLITVGGRGIDNAGATGTAITNNTTDFSCATGIRVSGASNGVSVQNNVIDGLGTRDCDPAFTDKVGIGVYDAALSGTTVDYNAVRSPDRPPYAWKATMASVEAFRAASGQGAHDAPFTNTTRLAVLTDSANSAAPGWQARDFYGHSPEDDPGVPNSGAGPVTYADRGHSETVRGPEAAFTITQRPGGTIVLDASGTKPGWAPIASYTFSFRDGPDVTQTSPIASHTYPTVDYRPVAVTVTDTNGLTSRVQKAYLPGDFYVPVSPVRVLDTREAIGTAGRTPVAPGGTLTLPVTGRAGVPAAGVTSVTMNVTVTGPTANGFLTVYPNGQDKPNASNLNWTPGLTVPNLVVVPVVNGKVDFHNTSPGTVHVVADLVGYHTKDTGGSFVPRGPVRVLDTREVAGRAPIAPGATLTLPVTGQHGIPPTGVTAVTMNVTVTGPTADGFLTVYPNGQAKPNASNLNWTPGLTVPNLVVVPVVNGKVDFHNTSPGTVHVVADVVGYHTPDVGTVFRPNAPYRVLDTRAAIGVPSTYPVYSGNMLNLDLGNLVAQGATSVVLNVTVTEPTSEGFLTAFGAFPEGPPNASNLNWRPGQTVPNLVVVPLNPANGLALFYNRSGGNVHVIADVVGYYGT